MFDTIVTATDGSEHARRALQLAAGLAAVHDATLVVVHVVGEGEVAEPLRRMAEVEHLVGVEHLGGSQVANLSGGISVAQRAETASHLARVHDAIAERLLEEARGLCKDAGAKRVEAIKESGDPARAIVRAIERCKGDLVVLGSRGMSDLKGLLVGSVSHKVMHLARCPCLTVR